MPVGLLRSPFQGSSTNSPAARSIASWQLIAESLLRNFPWPKKAALLKAVSPLLREAHLQRLVGVGVQIYEFEAIWEGYPSSIAPHGIC